MAFHVLCDFNRIQSYAQAIKAWQNAVIFPRYREQPLAPRGLVSTRKKHLTVEQAEAGDIILRLYGHPVVTWHEDNSVTLCRYDSRSSVVFGDHCTPINMHVSMCGGCFSVRIDGRTYKVEGKTTFRQRDNTWKPDTITPWSIRFVNRERARQALQDTNYQEFRLWLQVYLQMASPPRERTWAHDAKIVSMLLDRKWRELVTCFPNKSADQVLRKVRQMIHKEYDCFEHKPVAFL